MEVDDPWKWSVDRVVQELCTDNRSWQPYSPSMPRPKPILLEKALREQEVDGTTLLMNIGDKEMKEDLGIKVLGHRAFVRSAISDLRVKSVKFNEYVGTHHPQSASASHRSRSLNEFAPEHAPGIQHSGLDQYPISPGLSVGNGDTLIDRQSPSDEYVVDGSSNKRRKLGVNDSARNDAGQFADGINQEDATKDMVNDLEGLNGASDPNHQPDADTPLDVNGKKRKRIAPTLITSEIDPNRNRDIPSDADNVIHNDPQSIEPGVPFVDEDGKKKLLPILQSDPTSTEPYTYANRSQPISEERVSSSGDGKLLTIPSNGSKPTPRRKSRPAEDSIGAGYLGKRKMCVDDIFYEGIEAGQELPTSSDGKELSSGPTDILSGRRLYVSSMMRHFLRSKPQTFVRGRKFFSAVIPYAPKLAPRFQKPSFTLYSTSSDGQVHSRREEILSWPEINPEAGAQKSYSGLDEHSATFNPVGPDMLSGLGSYDQWDPDSLQKYQHLQGGDEILPLYGESDEENEYDEQTWQEIEKERGAKLEKPERPLKHPALGADEVNAAIDHGIASLAAKWKERKFPKLQFKAFGLWRKSHKLKTCKADILAAQRKLSHMVQRIIKIREEILLDLWSSKTQVLKQVSILEPSVFDREALAWTIAVLEKKTSPEKPSQAPPIKSKKSTVRSDDGEGDGESLDSDSSSDEEMDDFIVADDPMELEEEHELNLADGEGSEDDEMMSDVGHSERRPAKPVTPVKPLKVVHKGASTTSTASTPQTSEGQTPSTTASVKHEEPTLPKHRPDTASSGPNMIDLTGLTSDSGPEIVDLTIPKWKPKIKLINRNSPFSSPVPLDSEELPDSDNLPDFKDTASIGRYQSHVWEHMMDRERLLISILYRMDVPTRRRILDFISTILEPELWYNMAQVMSSCRDSQDGVKGMDAHTFETLTFFIRLFEVYADCRNHPYRELPTPSSIQKVEDSQKAHFTKFYKFFKKLPGYFDRRLSSQQSPSMSTPKGKMVANEESDEDGEPVPAVRRRRSEGLTYVAILVLCHSDEY
jgi:hypothetical protein